LVEAAPLLVADSSVIGGNMTGWLTTVWGWFKGNPMLWAPFLASILEGIAGELRRDPVGTFDKLDALFPKD
jgi:hypothetical protein